MNSQNDSVCMLIAYKFIESDINPEKFVYLSKELFSLKELLALEQEVLQNLNYKLYLVTPYSYLHIYLRISNECTSNWCTYQNPLYFNIASYMMDLSRHSYYLSIQKPSLVAASCIYVTRKILQDDLRETNWSEYLFHYTMYSERDLFESSQEICLLWEEAENKNAIIHDCYKKYDTRKRYNGASYSYNINN